jgi:hypothetical protein
MYTILSSKISSKRINDSLKDITISKGATIKFILDNENYWKSLFESINIWNCKYNKRQRRKQNKIKTFIFR